MLEILKKEDLFESYLLARKINERRIEDARNSATQFLSNRTSEQIRAEIGTALCGIIGVRGKVVILGADGQTTWGNQKYKIDAKKIYEIDKFTAVAGTGTVAFIQDIVKIFEAEVNFIQMSKSDGTFISPNGKATILADLVKSIIVLPLVYGIGIGFLLGVYNPKDDEARLFDIGSFGSISEKNILANGSGMRCVNSILDDRYEELGGKNMNRKNLKWLARRSIHSAIKNDIYCGGKKMLYIIDKYDGARGTK